MTRRGGKEGMVGHSAWHLEFLGDLPDAAGQNRTIITFLPQIIIVFILLDIGPALRNFLLDPLNICRTYNNQENGSLKKVVANGSIE
jgi:hypothetical protein